MASNESHDRGYFGEQSMGFILGEQGYVFIDGPGGAGGHGITSPGFDGVAYNPRSNHLIIYDNKAYRKTGNVGRASAIDGARLVANLSGMEAKVRSMQDLPDRDRILGLLLQLRKAVRDGRAWPTKVQIAVTNAGGRSTGVTTRLSRRGIEFVHWEDAGHPDRRSRRRR